MPTTATVASSPKLLDRVRWNLCAKHYSIRTEQAYVDWIRRYILFHHKRHPNEMGEAEISAFLNHLAINRAVAASTQNQGRTFPKQRAATLFGTVSPPIFWRAATIFAPCKSS